MTKPDYTFSWILPFVRASFKGRGEFDYRNFLQGLWTELEKAQVEGIIRTPPNLMFSGHVFQYGQAPYQLQALAVESYYYLIHSGFAVPKPTSDFLNHPNNTWYRLTERGLEWARGFEPLPDEATGFMKFLRQRVPSLDSVIEQYVIEALTAFERQAYFATAVMLGAASEKALYLLADSVLGAINDEQRRAKLQGLLNRRKLLELFEAVRNTVKHASDAGTLPYSVSEGAWTHLMSLYDAIRVQRNDAVHPMNAAVSANSIRLLIQSFPYALGKSEDLRTWFTANPKTI